MEELMDMKNNLFILPKKDSFNSLLASPDLFFARCNTIILLDNSHAIRIGCGLKANKPVGKASDDKTTNGLLTDYYCKNLS